jgi:Protein of unknown function (DUF3014)
MPEPGDYELDRTPGGPAEPKGSPGPWIAAVVVLIVAAAAVWYVVSRRHAATPAATPQPAAVVAPPPPPQMLPASGAAANLPPLDDSDTYVRDLVNKLSSNPQIMAWLATKGLIRNFALVVTNIADGVTPAPQLGVVRPKATFGVLQQGDQITLDPRSYARYDALADAIASLDPAGSARLYETLKPRIEEAYSDLGFPNTPFDRTLERAIVMLLETPTVTDPVKLEAAGAASYAFADPDLETLPEARRQLLRMGPRNVAKVRTALRALAAALGIRADRLPTTP